MGRFFKAVEEMDLSEGSKEEYLHANVKGLYVKPHHYKTIMHFFKSSIEIETKWIDLTAL